MKVVVQDRHIIAENNPDGVGANFTITIPSKNDWTICLSGTAQRANPSRQPALKLTHVSIIVGYPYLR